jgi:hypothetical protein
MIVCPTCGHHNQQEATICSACNSSLSQYTYIACPICGAHNKALDQYCYRCLTLLRDEDDTVTANTSEVGNPLDAPTDPLVELKQVLPPSRVDFSAPIAGSLPFEANTLAVEQMQRIATGAAISTPSLVVKPIIQPITPRAVHWILVISVFLIALVPFVITIKAPFSPLARNSVTDFAQTIANLPIDAVVLVSFDYGPTYAEELDSLARVILHHLSQRSARVLIMSTLPTGMGSAERVLDDIKMQDIPSQYGQNYLLMGYLAGEDSGLRLLTSGFSTAFRSDYLYRQDINAYNLITDAPTLAQVQRVIVLAEDASSIRRWVEQVQYQIPVRLDAAVSASAEPGLLPYYLSKQLSNLMGGLPAAVEYASLNDGQVADWRYTYSFTGLLILLILIALVTNITHLAQSKSRRS